MFKKLAKQACFEGLLESSKFIYALEKRFSPWMKVVKKWKKQMFQHSYPSNYMLFQSFLNLDGWFHKFLLRLLKSAAWLSCYSVASYTINHKIGHIATYKQRNNGFIEIQILMRNALKVSNNHAYIFWRSFSTEHYYLVADTGGCNGFSCNSLWKSVHP